VVAGAWTEKRRRSINCHLFEAGSVVGEIGESAFSWAESKGSSIPASVEVVSKEALLSACGCPHNDPDLQFSLRFSPRPEHIPFPPLSREVGSPGFELISRFQIVNLFHQFHLNQMHD
jgi:hypothetical protein